MVLQTEVLTQRRELVKELRAVAAKCGVPRVPDNAARDKVREMAEAILACGGLEQPDRDSATKDTWGHGPPNPNCSACRAEPAGPGFGRPARSARAQ